MAAALGGGAAQALATADFAAFRARTLAAQDDPATTAEQRRAFAVTQQGWRLMSDVADYHPACAQVLVGLVEGLAAASGRNVTVSGLFRLTEAHPAHLCGRSAGAKGRSRVDI